MEPPRRRADLEEITGPSGELVAFRDPVLDRRVDLGPVSRALVSRIDGATSVEQLVESVASELAVAREVAFARLRSLLLLHLLEGSGTRVLERARRLRGAPLELSIAPGMRFQCQGSGACCQGYHFGPLTDDDRGRLESLDLAGAGLGAGPYLEAREGQDPPSGTYLKVKADGSCVFLREDRRCGVHAAFGAAAKPGFCQAYPIRFLPTLHGLKALDAGECASFATSARSGPRLEDERERLRALAPPNLRVDHPVVFLGPETPCDLGHVLEIQEAVLLRLKSPGPVGERFLDAADFVLAAASALASCPLAPGEPEATLDRTLARLSEQPRSPVGPASRDSFEALARVLEELLAAYPLRLSDSRERDLTEVLCLGRDFARRAADPGTAPSEGELAVFRTDASGSDVEEPLAISLRQAFWGDQLFVERRVLPGLVQIATSLFLTVVGAKLRAWKASSPVVRAQDLSLAHSLVARVLRRRQGPPVFARHDGGARPVAAAVASWIAGEVPGLV